MTYLIYETADESKGSAEEEGVDEEEKDSASLEMIQFRSSNKEARFRAKTLTKHPETVSIPLQISEARRS